MWENWILETRTILPRTILPRQFLPNVKLVRHIAALSLPILDYRIQVQQKKKNGSQSGEDVDTESVKV